MDISIALGGGGVRGIAHLGVLRALEKHDFKVRAIAGTSAGGLVGAVYAAGFSTEEIENAFNELDQNRSFERSSDAQPSLLGLSFVANKLSALIGERTFEDLEIPFAATAVSLHSGKEIILKKGRVLDAVLATIAIPGVFPSQEIGGQVLVDGGVLDPVPVQVARWMRPDLPVVAVVLNKTPEGYSLDEEVLQFPIPGPTSIIDRLMKLRPVQAFRIFARAIEVSSQHLTELTMQIYQPEVIISPLVGHIGVLQNIDSKEMIQAGIDATEETMSQIKAETRWDKKLHRRVKQNLSLHPYPDNWEKLKD